MTPKQEQFARLYVELGNASEAYRQAYDTNAKPEVVHVKASELLARDNVAVRVRELQEDHLERHKLTVDDLIKELEEARTLAIKNDSPAPAVNATMGKARLLGLDKQVVKMMGDPDFLEDLREVTRRVMIGYASD